MNCKNCNTIVKQHFCPNCGQKASTQRFTVKSALIDVFFDNVLEVNKGLFYTIKQLFFRPGNSIRDYVQGKRINYRNYIELLLITITVSYFLGEYVTVQISDLLGNENMYEGANKLVKEFGRFSSEHTKLYMLMLIPINAVFSFLWFKKAKQNYMEHLVMITYKSSAELIISTFFVIITIFYSDTTVLKTLLNVVSVIILLYSIWFLYQYFSSYGYKKWKLFLLSILATISSQTLIGLVLAILA